MECQLPQKNKHIIINMKRASCNEHDHFAGIDPENNQIPRTEKAKSPGNMGG